MIKYNEDILAPHLCALFRATFDLQYYPNNWKNYTTVVLRKPGKTDYTITGAYRGIALLGTISKVLSSCVTEDLVYEAEQMGILPEGHYGGRPGRTSTDALHAMHSYISAAWRKKRVAAFLFLDVKAAFPSVLVHRLVHDMRMRGVPKEYTSWITRKLSNRKTTIRFDDHISKQIDIQNGIDQGCPLSGVLYQFYNSQLLEVAQKGKGEIALGYIDDVAFGVSDNNFHGAYAQLQDMYEREGGASEWAKLHASQFSHEKNQVTGFTRKTVNDPNNPKKKIPLPKPDLVLNGQIIPTVNAAKYLGVLVDSRLTFSEHALYALARGTSLAMQIRRLSRPSSGMPAHHTRQLYNTVVVPRMLYATEVFCADKLKIPKSNSGFLAKLSTVQRMLTLQITGAMRSSPNDSIDLYANLLPFRLLVQKLCHRAAIRLAALPSTHPLYKEVKCRRKMVRKESTIYKITHFFGIDPNLVEKIKSMRGDPKDSPKSITEIIAGKDNAKRRHTSEQGKYTVIYTDGSGYEGGIGAGAVLIKNNGQQLRLQYHLGTQEQHTVYEAELVGIRLALHLIRANRINKRVIIATDNQAAIMALDMKKPSPGYYLVEDILQAQEELKTHRLHRALQIVFRWVPAHLGIDGNEIADQLAKEAATGKSNAPAHLPKQFKKVLPYSASALKTAFMSQLKKKTMELLTTSPRYTRLLETDPSIPSANYQKIMADLPRKHASIITQLRTGHIPLMKHLHRINKAESPICPACHDAQETVYHYLLRCPEYNEARNELELRAKKYAYSIPKLLADRSIIPYTLRYVARTGRLKSTFGEIKEVRLDVKSKRKGERGEETREEDRR